MYGAMLDWGGTGSRRRANGPDHCGSPAIKVSKCIATSKGEDLNRAIFAMAAEAIASSYG